LKQELSEGRGRLSIEMRNDSGQYASPGADGLSMVDIGSELYISPGYVTAQGNEASTGQSFLVETYAHTSSAGKSSFIIHASDSWASLKEWKARHQFRWNKDAADMLVKDMLAFVLARAGIKLVVKSQSSVITGFYPDFTIQPGNSGTDILSRLLAFVPDLLFIEGSRAYLINPLASDTSVYSYGLTHVIFEGRYGKGSWRYNRVRVEGYDSTQDTPVIASSFAWSEIDRLYERLRHVEDRNISSASEALERGESHLRKAEIATSSGEIRIPVNCGQQLYDVIDITDNRAGLEAEKRRVLGINLLYNPSRGEYEQRLSLGNV